MVYSYFFCFSLWFHVFRVSPNTVVYTTDIWHFKHIFSGRLLFEGLWNDPFRMCDIFSGADSQLSLAFAVLEQPGWNLRRSVSSIMIWSVFFKILSIITTHGLHWRASYGVLLSVPSLGPCAILCIPPKRILNSSFAKSHLPVAYFAGWRVTLNFCTEHDNDTAMLCAKFQKE